MEKTVISQPKSVNGAFDELLNKMYISNVQNRLRQLNEPTENDSKRWVWELIQNAKDTIAHDNDRDFVDIQIIVRGTEVKFSHNGAPFTAKAQLGLLYKYSEGKGNSSESTGRFGTGFLTTHTLSKIVKIEGDVFTEEEERPICGFSATMYRDGLDEDELLSGIKKMNKSRLFTEELNGWTTYTYYIKTPQNESALKLGLENFLSNITQTMLFCKELRSVNLDNEGKITTIERKSKIELTDNIYVSEFEIKGDTKYSRRFLHKKLEKYSEDLSLRFKTDRNVRLTAAIEIDSNNNIVENTDTPSHYCVLPLVGSEKHVMPIYLNSPDFEPDSERESLILIGEDILADKGVISEGGINRLILSESVALYESLVAYLTENGYHNLHLLAKGLKKAPKVERNFNTEWFKDEIIDPFRDVLTRYKVIETKVGNQTLFNEDGEAYIIIPKDTDIENQEIIYKLAADIFTDKLPLEKYANEWAMLAWKDCGLFKAEDLCEYVQGKETIEALPVTSDKYEWLNNFLSFIKNKDEGLFKKYALIPNRDGYFVSLENEEFAEGVELTNYSLSVLKDLGEDLNAKLLDSNIHAVNLPVKIDAKSIAEKINEQAKIIIENGSSSVEEKITQLLPLINTIPNTNSLSTQVYSSEFIEKQNNIVGFATILYPDIKIEKEENNDIPKKAWDETYKWLINQMIDTVAKIGSVDDLPYSIDDKIVWMNRFITFVSGEITAADLDEHEIIPNQNGVFWKREYLAKDIDIPEVLKSERAEAFGIELKSKLLHKGIDAITISKEKNINSIIEIINDIFSAGKYNNDDSELSFAIYLLHFLPNETSQAIYNSQDKLLRIARQYFANESALYTPTVIPCDLEGFWRKSNDIIIKTLQNNIKIDGSIEGLMNYLNATEENYDEGDTIIFLNDLYDYLKHINKPITHDIVPNQNGVFCSLEEDLYHDEDIPEIMKDILLLADPEKDFRNILANPTLSVRPNHPKHVSDIARLIDDAIKIMYAHPFNWQDEKFKEAVSLLMIDWFPEQEEEEEVENIFSYTYKMKETIEMNVLWSRDERQRMQRARSIDPKVLDKFIEENGKLDDLEKKKEKLEKEVNALEAKIKEGMPESIAKEFPDITADRIRELLDLEERAKGWDCRTGYKPTSEDEERRNYINGYKGEAYIYSQLKKSGQFKNIVWAHKTDEVTNMSIIDYEKNIHYISEDYSKYDLTAETLDGKKVYFEVKSTRTSLDDADNIALPISTREWNYVNDIDKDEKYFLARVFNVEHVPQGHYLSLMGVELEKIKM